MSDRSIREARRPQPPGGPAPPEGWQDLPDPVKFGDVCYQAERYADALDAYLRALEKPSAPLSRELKARIHYRVAGCYTERANYRLALDHLDEARRILPRHLDKVRLAKIYALRGWINLSMGHYARAERYLVWARKLLRGTNEHEELALVELRLGAVYLRRGEFPDARDCLLTALTAYRRLDNPTGEAGALNNLALLHKNTCEFREAVRYLELARGICERCGFRRRLITVHLNLGIIHFKLSKWELCEENLTAASNLAVELNSDQSLVRVQLAQANLALRRRQWDRAESLYLRAKRVAEEQSYTRELLLAREFLGELHLAQGAVDLAIAELEPCLTEARKIAPAGDLVFETLRRLAEARLGQGRYQEALDLARESAAGASRLGDRYEEAVALRVVGLAMLHLGQLADGERIIRMSLDSIGEIGDSFQKGMTHLHYGRYLADAARRSGSIELLERAGTHLHRAYGAFLDLDARILAARAAFERASLEVDFRRFEEAAGFRARARQVMPLGGDQELERELTLLDRRLDDAFAENWSTGGDVLSSLRELKRLFQGATNTTAALEELIRLAVTRSRSSRGCVALATLEGELEIAGAYGWLPGDAQEYLKALGPVLDEAVRENRAVWSTDVAESPRFAFLAGEHGVRSLVLMPFSHAEGKIGLLYVDKTRESREEGYHQGELHLLTILANLAALSVMERWNTQLALENQELKKKIAGDGTRFLTAHPALLDSLRLVKKVANSPVSILVVGETGTGKGLLAEVIHEASNRKGHPFVTINCAALPEQLLESELFGHMKGAFTGATYNKVGLFQEADGGTLFLDEVDKTSLAVQAKLLQVMDTKEVRSVGSVKSSLVDTRVVCATNADLQGKIRSGEFLEDLYYRLNDFTVKVPPLRERPEDLPLLLEHFLEKFGQQYGRQGIRLTPELRHILLNHPWPGNVRELEKAVRRLVVLAEDEADVGMELLPPEMQTQDLPRRHATLREELARTERRVLADALRAADWNRSQVSRELKISYPSLLKKIREYRLKPRN